MNSKSLIVIICILVLAQVLMFDYLKSESINKLDLAVSGFKTQHRNLELEKSRLAKELSQTKALVETIPPWLMTGFEDPEVGFVEFLDFLKGLKDFGVQSDVTVGNRRFLNSPIPVHASDFDFKYTFNDTYDAEKFINFLVFQERFPLTISRFTAKRGSDLEVGGSMKVTLLIPARLVLAPKPGKSEGK